MAHCTYLGIWLIALLKTMRKKSISEKLIGLARTVSTLLVRLARTKAVSGYSGVVTREWIVKSLYF